MLTLGIFARGKVKEHVWWGAQPQIADKEDFPSKCDDKLDIGVQHPYIYGYTPNNHGLLPGHNAPTTDFTEKFNVLPTGPW